MSIWFGFGVGILICFICSLLFCMVIEFIWVICVFLINYEEVFLF